MHNIASSLRFMEFNDYSHIVEHPNILNSLTQSYCEIFLSSWGETWSQDDVAEKLAREMTGMCNLRIALEHNTNRVVGFIWIQMTTKRDIIEAISHLKSDTDLNTIDLNLAFGHIDSCIYIHDIGIAENYRGRLPLAHLIFPSIDRVAQLSKTREIAFWSATHTAVCHLAKKIGITPCYEHKQLQFFHGHFPYNVQLTSDS